MSQLSFFYEKNIPESGNFTVSEESSRHIVQVLRMGEGGRLQLTNGRGVLATVEITVPNKKKTGVKIVEVTLVSRPGRAHAIAVSLIKNTGRFEWFLEKATEAGISEIFPLLCQRTEKSHFREERMQSILISAMLQSRQVYLPVLHTPVKYSEFLETSDKFPDRFIAHCVDDEKKSLRDSIHSSATSAVVLIGPEGDFTPEEIQEALSKKFMPVSLGETRLRTETAAFVAAVLLDIW